MILTIIFCVFGRFGEQCDQFKRKATDIDNLDDGVKRNFQWPI